MNYAAAILPHMQAAIHASPSNSSRRDDWADCCAADRESLYSGVDRLLDGVDDPYLAIVHRIHCIGADRWRAAGRRVPEDWAADLRTAALRALTVQRMVQVIRETIDGPMIVLKGPEIAARYDRPEWRPFTDLDLLCEDAEAAHAALIENGWRPQGKPETFAQGHHLQPLVWRHQELPVEIHARLNWPKWTPGPDPQQLFALRVPSRTGIAGVDALPADLLAVYVAAHSWVHHPLGKVGDLLDVAILALESPADHLNALSRQWGVEGIWEATRTEIDRVLLGLPSAKPASRLLGRNLMPMSAPSYAQSVVEQSLGALAAPSTTIAARAMFNNVRAHVRVAPGETVWDKTSRIGRVVTHGGADRMAVFDHVIHGSTGRPSRLARALRPSTLEAAVWAAASRVSLRAIRFERTVTLFDRLALRPAASLPSMPPARCFSIAGACLGQSLARSQFLRRRGARHSLVLGVLKEGQRFEAHAWISPLETPPAGFAEIRRIDR